MRVKMQSAVPPMLAYARLLYRALLNHPIFFTVATLPKKSQGVRAMWLQHQKSLSASDLVTVTSVSYFSLPNIYICITGLVAQVTNWPSEVYTCVSPGCSDSLNSQRVSVRLHLLCGYTGWCKWSALVWVCVTKWHFPGPRWLVKLYISSDSVLFFNTWQF